MKAVIKANIDIKRFLNDFLCRHREFRVNLTLAYGDVYSCLKIFRESGKKEARKIPLRIAYQLK